MIPIYLLTFFTPSRNVHGSETDERLISTAPHCMLDQGKHAPSQYPKRRLSVRSRKALKPRDLYLELSDRSDIWQALRQHCCRCACQILKRYDNLKYQSRGFEISRDLTKRRLSGYWDGALLYFSSWGQHPEFYSHRYQNINIYPNVHL